MSETRNGWFAAEGHIVGNVNNWTTEYCVTGKFYESRALAISAGFSEFRHDDFNVGRVKNGRLVWFGWMDEKHPADDYHEVAAALGLKPPTKTSAPVSTGDDK